MSTSYNLWKRYQNALKEHNPKEGEDHIKDKEDESCEKCHPKNNQETTNQEFKNFTEWIKAKYKILSWTGKTYEYFDKAQNEENEEEQENFLKQIVFTMRYKSVYELNKITERIILKWKVTEGFQSDKMENKSRKGRPIQNQEDDLEEEEEDYCETLHIGQQNEKGYQSPEEESTEGEEEEIEPNIILAKALTKLSKSIESNKQPTTRESRIVEFPEFKGGSQDPINWFDTFEEACYANNVKKARKLQIARAYIKGEARTWLKKSKIEYWDSELYQGRSFKHQFMKKYCGIFSKTTWRQQLRDLKQAPGETIESYFAKIIELWQCIDPEDNRTESDKIIDFMEGLKEEFILPVQTAMPKNVQTAVDTAKAVEIRYSRGMKLSEYSKRRNTNEKNKGKNLFTKTRRYHASTNEKESNKKIICFKCGREGHIKQKCQIKFH